MKFSSVDRGFVAGNPIANIFVIIVGALAISAAVVLGFFAFVVLGSIVLILAAIVSLRIWWFNRQAGSRTRQGDGGSPKGGIIEGEYRVVADERADE